MQWAKVNVGYCFAAIRCLRHLVNVVGTLKGAAEVSPEAFHHKESILCCIGTKAKRRTASIDQNVLSRCAPLKWELARG